MKNILNRNLEVELKNSKFKIINKSFVLNNLIAVIIIALCFTILPIANTPLAQAESSQTAQTQKTSTSANNNHASNDHISNDHASNKTAPNNLIDPPPAVNNVTISRSQNHNSVVVTWSAPDTPPASYTYRVDLINNISSVAQSINNINSNITNASFNNLSTGNYNAVVYTVVDNILSNPVQSSVPISVALSPIATSTNFNDIAKLPANFQAAIKWAAIYTITAGYSDGGFHPATPTTRGQMATFFHKLAGNPNTQGTPTAFKDIAKSVHKADINWLSTQGITAGYSCTAKGKPVITCAKKGDLVYYPEGKITRVQMATFLYKFASSPTMTPDEVNSYLSTFKDKEQIIASGQDTPIAWLVKNNITKGFTCTAFGSPDPACTKAGDIVFRPKYNTTRQQMVLFLQKAAATLNLSAYLKAEGSNPSTFLGVSNPTRDQITKISFQDTLPKCSNPTDVSADGSGGVLVCVNNLTELVVGSVGQVPANSNSSNLFANLLVANSTNLAGVQIDFTNFNTTGLINTAAMFANTKLAQVSNWSPDFANTSKNMSNMFASASLPVNLALPSDFGIAVQDMSNMFDKAVLQSNIEWKQTDFTDRTGVKKQNMFDGTVWNNHVIYALNEPSVNFFLDNTKALPDNIMIKGGTSYLKVEGSNPSTFLGLSNPTRDAITKVSFQNQLPVCSNPTDVSVDGGGGVLACVENNTEIVIGANGGVLANDNSSYLLANLSKSTGVDIDLSNLKNDIIDNMSSLFQNSKLKILINCPTNFGSTTSNMQSMFAGATLPDNLILPPRFANRAINMTNMWQNAVLGGDIDWSFTDFNNHAAATKTNMFTGVSWNTHSVLVQDNIDQAFLIDQTGATVNNIQIKNYSSVLKAESANPATFLGLASPTRDAITKISFQNTLPSCTNPVDVSVDGKNGVLACVENNTEIVIGSKGGVLANEDSSNLLSNLTKSTGVTIDLSSFYGFSATNMSNFFKSTILKSTPIWSDGFGGSVANMSNLFQQSTLSADFSLPAGFGSQATNMSNIFASVSLPSNFILPAQFGSQATNMSSAFANSTLNTDIDWSSVDFNGKTGVTKTNMWQNTVWNNHYVLVKNSGTVIFLITDSAISDSSRIIIKGASPILKIEMDNPSTFLGVPNLTRNNITKISFRNTFPVCANPTDVSVDGKGGVIACVNNSTEIVIGASGWISANANTSNLLANLSVNSGVNIDLVNLNTATVTNMSNLFTNSKLESTPNWSTNFGSIASNISNMFANCVLPASFTLPANFASQATNMSNIFASVSLPSNFILPAQFGSQATNMSSAFANSTLNTDIDWSSVDFNGKTGVTKTNMWQNTVWNNHYVLVKNVESVAFLIADSGISDSSRIKVKGASSTLKAENSNPSTFLGVPNLTRNNITKISFQNTFPVCANPTDVSVDGKAGVIACVNNSTEIVIGANEGVLANANSAYLFANLSVNSGVDIDLDNFNNAVLDNMSFMFQNSKIKSIINYPSNFGSTASNMQSMFEETTFPDEFILPVRFGNRVTNTTNMFTGAILTGNIDWSFTDFDNHPATITTSMFNNTSWNNYFILVQDIGDLTFLTTNTGASLSNIQIKSHSSVLKAETVNPTNFLNMPNLTRAQITKLTFQKTLPICSNPTDVSVDGKNGVLACVTGTEITIGSNGGVVANANSQYLFANLTNSNGVDFDLTHLYTYLTTDISAMFQSTIIKSTPNWSDAFADLATNMTNLFQNASLPDGFSLPQSFGLAADNMSNAFQGATLKGNINWSNSDFSDKSGVNVTNMFKNTTWNNYYLWVANQDSLVFLTNNTSALAYININIKGTVLKAEVANPVTFLNLASPTRDAITKITWQTTLPTCSNPTDLSADEAGGILACVVASKQVIIGSKNGVLANINSSNLFANLKVNDGVSIDFSGLNTVAVTDMTNMFQNTWLKSMANWPQGFGSQTINMSSMFNNAKLFYGFTLPDGFGSKALDMSSMFKNCILPARFVFPSIFGSKAINMSSMFEQSYFPLNFAFLDTFGNSATNMSSMFRGAGITNYVDWGDNYSFKDHPEANKTDMFTDTRWSVNGGVIWVADSVAEAFLTNNTGATVDNIKTRNLSHTLKTAGFNDQLFLGIPGSDKKDIHQIFFQNKFPTVCSTLTDVSADDSRGVLGCFNNGNIIIGAPGGVVANYNSSNLFARLSYSYGVNIYLDNFVASGIQIMDHMFAGDSGDKNLTTINVVTNIPLNFGTAPQTSAPYMFSYAVLEGFEFPHDFGSFISNARNMFANCSLPNGFTVPSKLTITQDMRSMFSGASLPAGFNIPHDFGSLALDTSNMFDNAKLNGDIDWSYVDFSGKSSVTKTDMFKDTVWNNHFILVKNIGSVNFFITDSGISDNSRIKIKGTNNTLKAEVVNPSTFFNLSSPTRAQITKVSFQNTFPLCDNPTDVSADGKGGVIVCVVNNTEIVIGGSGKTVANTNSSNLLANLSVNDGVDIDLTNLDTATVTDMSNMFAASKLKSTPVWSDNFAKVSPNMAYMFSGTLLPNNFSLPNDFGRAVTNMAYMWQNCIFPVGFVLPDGFGQAAISMIHMFEGTTFSTDFTLSSNFGFAAGDMSYMFSKATLKANLDWTKTNFDSRLEAGVAKTAMFDGVVWNNYYIKAVNLESRDFLTDGTEAVADINIKAGDIVTLKAEGSDPSLFLGIPGSYRYAISKIIWQNALPTCSSPVDVSSDGGGKIIGCVINDTEIVIGSNGDIVANADSSNLFANLTKSTGVDINFKNLYVNDINKMISMFKKSKIQSITNLSNHFGVKTDDMSDMFFSAALPANFSLPAKFGSAAKNMSGMFRKTSLPTNFSLPDGFGSQANNMSYMFLYIDLSNLNNFSLPDNFGSQATNIADMFFGSNLPANFVLPANFASATQDMSDLFANAILSGNIDWSGTDFSGKTGVNKSDMFSDVNWNNYYILAKNTESVKFLITDSGISDTSRVKVK